MAVLTLLGVAGCADAKPFDYTPVHEIPPGPGLLSGQDGSFTFGFGAEAEPDSPETREQNQN